MTQTQPCRSGHTDCTADCGWCKGTGINRPTKATIRAHYEAIAAGAQQVTQTQEARMTDFTHAGTVSHGTLRTEDLAPAFLSVLQELNLTRWSEISQEYADALAHLEQGLEPNPDDEQALMEALHDALNDAAPEGWFFGAHEGDGSDFGFFWWGEDEPEDVQGCSCGMADFGAPGHDGDPEGDR